MKVVTLISTIKLGYGHMVRTRVWVDQISSGDRQAIYPSWEAFANKGMYEYNEVATTTNMLVDIWAQLTRDFGPVVSQFDFIHAASHTIHRGMSSAQIAIAMGNGVEVKTRKVA